MSDTQTEMIESAHQTPCPYVKQDAEGTAHCALAETGIKVFEQQARENEQLARDWQHEFVIYRNAWLRELGGKLINKHHEIDAFVLTTRTMREELEALQRASEVLTRADHITTDDGHLLNRSGDVWFAYPKVDPESPGGHGGDALFSEGKKLKPFKSAVEAYAACVAAREDYAKRTSAP
jgi:hypothetical protein